MRKLGVPYDAAVIEGAVDQAESQAVAIADGLTAEGETAAPDTELIALIAYLQKLGQFDTPQVEEKLLTTPVGIPFPMSPVNPDKARRARQSDTASVAP